MKDVLKNGLKNAVKEVGRALLLAVPAVLLLATVILLMAKFL